MIGLEKMSKNIELAESKKKILEQSILSLLDQYKDFEGQMDLTRKDFSGVFSELDFREKKLNSEEESLELTQKSIEQRLIVVGNREKDFELFREKKMRDLKTREEEFVRVRDVYMKEIGEELSEREKRAQELMSALKSERIQNSELKNYVEERFKEMAFEEKSLEVQREEIKLIRTSIQARSRELERKEGEIKEREKNVEIKEEELDLWKARYDETQLKEKQLDLMIEDLELQEKSNAFLRELNEAKMKELDVKEKELEVKLKHHFHSEETGCGLKDLESKRKEFEEQIKEFELRKKELQEEIHSKNNEFLSEKNAFEKASKNVDVRAKELEERTKQLELQEKALKESLHLKQTASQMAKERLEKYSEDLDSKRKGFAQRIEEFNGRKKVFEESFQSEKNLLEKGSNHLESRRKELEESIKKFELREKELESKEKQFQSERNLLEKESARLDSRRKEVEESFKKIELREKEVERKENQLKSVPDNAHLKTEQIQGANGQSSLSNSTDFDIRLIAMEGKELQIFLNDNEKDHNLVADKVFKALQLCKDPAQLVLSAMEGFVPPHLRKGNKTFSGYVVKRSCMLLLRQLIRISPYIQPCVRDEALRLARDWKAKIATRNSLEVSCFLYLLASYNMASAFDADDIIRYLKFASPHQQKLEPELCRRLGLKDKIPSLIENLLQSNQSLEAVKFIYGFEIVDCFPPVPILKKYLDHVKMCAITTLEERRNTKKARIECIDTRVAAIRSVIRCIVEYQLESQISRRDLENTEKQLLMQKGDKNFTGFSNFHESRGKQTLEVKQISSTAAPSQPNIPIPLEGAPHPMAIIIANMDGKNLLSFLSSRVVEHELLHNEVSSALQISDNSPKLVLGAVKSFYNSHQSDKEMKSCIFLLEKLTGLSPDIMPDVKEAAQKIAFDLEATLKAENGNLLLISMFLLLVSNYRLSSSFRSNELLGLYQRVAEQKPSPGLRISRDMYTDAAAPRSQVETQKVKNLAVSSLMVPGLDDEFLCTDMDSEEQEPVSGHSEVPTFISHSSDPADLILEALRSCYWSNFTKNKNPLLVFKSFCRLLEQLMMNVSVEINPHLKGRAYELAHDWKAKSNSIVHHWEALGFLQLVATYQLSPGFSSNELFGFLESVGQPKNTSNFIRMFGLVDKVPEFLSQLIKRRKLLHAFAYVYEFKLIEVFPPVALLKQHVLYSKFVAKKVCNEAGNTPKAQDNAVVKEIGILKTVIKLIRQRGLQSEYSPNELQSTIKQLEIQRTKLKTSAQKVASASVFIAPQIQMQNAGTKKRPACDAEDAICISEAYLQQPTNKIPRLIPQGQFIVDPHPIPS